ncbi:MAG: hypothetical protein C4560_00790 [Nitrospiraceae bacterium]|nr:MAG: hypothetical protein C4560_00790 [Nitrospiraceae bacterium]
MMRIIIKPVVAIALFVSLGLAHPCGVNADVSVDIHIGPPPVYVVPAPPEVVVIPGTYAYFIPGITVDIIFYQGYWYRPYNEYWYRAGHYNGPWKYIVRQSVPVAILNLPPDYRHVPPGHQRIPYGQLKKNWRGWEQERHWEGGPSHGGPPHGRGKGRK